MVLQKMQLSIEVSEDGVEYNEIYLSDLQKVSETALDFECLAILYKELKLTYGYEVKLGFDSLSICFRTREEIAGFEHNVAEIIEEVHHDLDGKYTKFRAMVQGAFQTAIAEIDENLEL